MTGTSRIGALSFERTFIGSRSVEMTESDLGVAGTPPLLKIVDLHKRFANTEVLCGVNLDVARGQKVTIIGPSGSGKTTLLRCINYLEKPTAGHVYIDGVMIGEKRSSNGTLVHMTDRELARERQEIGFVFQRFNLFPHLTALQNVTIAPRKVLQLSRSEAEERGREMLCKVGLAHKINEFPERLSGGQQQRVAIARVLCMQPKLMLFDEATSALDPELVGEVLRVMRDLASEGRTMIIVTHEIQFAAEVSDRVIFMDHGAIVEQGSPLEILKQARQPRTRAFLSHIQQR
jgi:polar amino acid transport system ATP-binding protein